MYETFLRWLETPLPLTVIIAVMAYFVSRDLRIIAGQSFRRSGLRDDAFNDFAWRQFKRREFVEISTNGSTEKIQLFKEAKVHAHRAFLEDQDHWREASQVQKTQNWQNHVAYEASDALQQLGIAVFTGTVDLDVVVVNLARTIIDDWVLSSAWLESWRLKSNTTKIMPIDRIVYYERRHAECLFLIAFAFMRHSNWPLHGSLVSKVGEFVEITDIELRNRILALSNADGKLMPPLVRTCVKRVTGFSISN
jgi:hypothetical protein